MPLRLRVGTFFTFFCKSRTGKRAREDDSLKQEEVPSSVPDHAHHGAAHAHSQLSPVAKGGNMASSKRNNALPGAEHIAAIMRLNAPARLSLRSVLHVAARL